MDYDISEFELCGLTPLPSLRVRPPRVKEAMVQMECELVEVVHGGSGPPNHSRGRGTAEVDSLTEIQGQAEVFAQGGRCEHRRLGNAMSEQAVDRCGIDARVLHNHLRQHRVLVQGEQWWSGRTAFGCQLGDADDGRFATQPGHDGVPRRGS